MADFRCDPISGRWVIIAEDRAGRPSEFMIRPDRRVIDPCPFCPEHESETPPAIATYRAADSAGSPWQVRVIPNKYPAATLAGAGGALGASSGRIDAAGVQWKSQPGMGIHEVIVESPRHVDSLSELSAPQTGLVMNVYRDRLAALGKEPRLEYAVMFKNCRGGGGATLEHVHSQLLGTSFIPLEVERELQATEGYFRGARQCLSCVLLEQERAAGTRIVGETLRFVAFCPFASRFPYETWILPKTHSSRFEQTDARELDELGGLVLDLLIAFDRESGKAAYNYWTRSAPYRAVCDEFFHWRMELIPRTTTPGGYEWGTGSFVNPVSPESAARRLARSAQVS